jgi:hypothetical protein
MDSINRIIYVFIFFVSVVASGATVNLDRQAQVKAAFIFQFRNYVTWPEGHSANEPRSFLISIVGRDKGLLQELEKLAKEKKMNNRPIEVKLFESADRLPKSDIIVVGTRDLETLQGVARKTKGEHTLIVSQAEDFARKGAMINFFIEDERLRFEINLGAVKKADLQISSQLLNLAKLVIE